MIFNFVFHGEISVYYGKIQRNTFFSDLDGTLLNSDGVPSEENLREIEFFKREGGLFTFVTGRMHFFAENIYRAVRPNAPIDCINGGGLYDFKVDKFIWRQPIWSNTERELLCRISSATTELLQSLFQKNVFGVETEREIAEVEEEL